MDDSVEGGMFGEILEESLEGISKGIHIILIDSDFFCIAAKVLYTYETLISGDSAKIANVS